MTIITIIKVFKQQNTFTYKYLRIWESEYQIFHDIVSKFVNIFNKKKKIYKTDTSVIMRYCGNIVSLDKLDVSPLK